MVGGLDLEDVVIIIEEIAPVETHHRSTKRSGCLAVSSLWLATRRHLVDRRQQMSPDPFSLVTPDERSEIRGPSRPWQHGPRLARLRRFAGVTTEDVLHRVSCVRVAPLERVPDGALESAFLGSVTQLS